MKHNIIILILLVAGLSFTTNSQILWSNTFGGANNDEGTFVRKTSDGGFLVIGTSDSFGTGLNDFWLIKTEANGNSEWTKTFELSAGDAQETQDNGFIVSASKYNLATSDYDIVLMKTNNLGDSLWAKTYGGNQYDGVNRILLTSDGGYAIIAVTSSYGAGNYDLWFIKTDSNGDTLWTETYGGGFNDLAFSGQQTSDGGYILAGSSQLSGLENSDVWLVKINETGEVEWTNTFGGDQDDLAYDVKQTSDDGYILTGYTRSYGEGFFSLYLIKTDELGDSLWTKVYGGEVSDFGTSVSETQDNGFAICGLTQSYTPDGNSDVWLIKTDSDGDIQWMDHFGGEYGELGNDMQITEDGGFIITGFTESYGAGDKDVLLIQTGPGGFTDIEDYELISVNSIDLQQNFPNPFEQTTTISYQLGKSGWVTLNVYDVMGREVSSIVDEYQSSGSYNAILDASGLDGGIFYYRIQVGENESIKKCLLTK